jgi:hypothetical protein
MTNEKALEIVRKNGCKLETLDIAFRANRRIVMEAIDNCPTALEFASKELRKNEKLVERALRSNYNRNGYYNVFQWVDDSLKGDKDFVLKIIRYVRLDFVNEMWRNDEDVVSNALRYDKEKKECLFSMHTQPYKTTEISF